RATNSGKRAKRRRRPAAPRPCLLRAIPIPIRKRKSPSTNDRSRRLPVPGRASRAPTWATRVRNAHTAKVRKNEDWRLKSEVSEGFLRSGTAKNAVPPVGMTNLGWQKIERRLNIVEVGPPRSIRLKQKGP